MPNIEITNIKEVGLDISKYDKKVSIKNRRTMYKYAQLIKNRMKWILRQKVKNWTGNLASSITTRILKDTATIKPNTVYDKWIEVGGGKFKGYQYVEGAFDRYEKQYIKEIQKNIKV